MPSSRALRGGVCRAQALTGLIVCGAPTSQSLRLSIRTSPYELMRGRILTFVDSGRRMVRANKAWLAA